MFKGALGVDRLIGTLKKAVHTVYRVTGPFMSSPNRYMPTRALSAQIV